MIKYIVLFIFINIIPTHIKANIVVLNGLTHHIKTDKGQIYKGKIELQNTGKTVKTVKLYLQDLKYSADGTTDYSSPGTNTRTNSNWINISTNLIEIMPGQKEDILYELVVPNHIVDPGSYWCTLMVEPVEDFKPNEANNQGVRINSIIRYAIQIITDLSTTDLAPELIFKNVFIDYNGQQRILNINLANEGNIFCRTIIALDIYKMNETQKIDKEFVSQRMGLLPSTSKRFFVDISTLPIGKYTAIAFAKDEQENVFALEFELDIEK